MQGVIGSSPIPSTKNRNESCGSFLLFGIFFDPLKAAAFGGSKYLIAVRRDIAQDLLYITMQNPAKVIQCGCIQRLVFSQFINGGTGYVVLGDEGIGAFSGRTQCFPKRIVYNYTAAPPQRSFIYNIVQSLS